MKLPASCPHRRSAKNWSPYEDGAAQCCRTDDYDISVFIPKQAPLCADIAHTIEEYRFVWRSSFNGRALVHIGRGEQNINLDWACRGRQGNGCFSRSIDPPDWTRLEGALLAAGFWAISPEEERQGILLDGAEWVIEGRRCDVYRVVRRGSPRGAIYDLGRVFLDIAGPPIDDIQLY